jgi:hypothetical protein
MSERQSRRLRALEAATPESRHGAKLVLLSRDVTLVEGGDPEHDRTYYAVRAVYKVPE